MGMRAAKPVTIAIRLMWGLAVRFSTADIHVPAHRKPEARSPDAAKRNPGYGSDLGGNLPNPLKSR